MLTRNKINIYSIANAYDIRRLRKKKITQNKHATQFKEL